MCSPMKLCRYHDMYLNIYIYATCIMFCTALKFSIIVVSVMSMLLSFCVMDSWICLGFECDVLMLHSLTCFLSTCRLYYAWCSLAVLYNTAHKMPQHVPTNSSAYYPSNIIQHYKVNGIQNYTTIIEKEECSSDLVVRICVYINIRIISSICKSSVAFDWSTVPSSPSKNRRKKNTPSTNTTSELFQVTRPARARHCFSS